MDNPTCDRHKTVMDQKFDIIIVGGGLAGATMSVALSGRGARVCLLDAHSATQQTDADFDGRAYALSASSVAMFRMLGIWEAVAEKAQPISDIKVSDGRSGAGASPLFLHFDHQELDGGPFGHMIEDRYLRRALQDVVNDKHDIEYINETKVTDIGDGAVSWAGGQALGDLIIGCDGRRSGVAKSVGIARMGWEYDQASVVCAVAHEQAHDGIAHQFFTPAGPLAILPLPGNRSSIVWTETRARAARLVAMSESDFLTELRPVFGSFLGEIALEGHRYTYPLGLTIAERFVAPGVALVGDAAHGIHPLAGQGLNLGLRDVAALAEVLVEARQKGEFIGSENVLKRYEQWRRFDSMGLAIATDGVNKLFSNDNSILRAVRDIGLAAVGQLPALRRRLMREAAGLEGDLPKLLRGQPL